MLRSDPRIHYKMYKAKKNMVYAALFSFAVLGGLGLSQNAEADTVENTASQPVVTNVGNSNITSTPTSQPATDVTTAHAANVNTANSAPTAQPVAAQSVSNSNARSASNVANQTQTNTLNGQSVQPAPKVAAINRANLYTQSLAQVQSNQAQNVQAKSYDWSFNDGEKNQAQPHSYYDFGHVIQWHTDVSFDVTADQLRAGQPINIGQFCVTQTPVNSYEDTFKWDNFYGQVIIHNADGAALGQVGWTNNNNYPSLELLPNKDFQGTGVQHATITGLLGEVGYMPWTDSYRGKGAISTQLTWHLFNQTFTTTIGAPSLAPIVDPKNSPMWEDGAGSRPGTAAMGNEGILDDRITKYLSSDQINAYLNSHGQNLGTNANFTRNGDEIAYRLSSSNNTMMPADHMHIEKWGLFVDSQGNVHNEINYVNNYTYDNLKVQDAGNDRTIAQMKSLLPTTVNGSKVYCSRQNDGTLLYYIYISPQDLKANLDLVKQTANHAATINLDTDPEKAVENTVNYYQNGPLKGFPLSDSIILYNNRADNQINTHVTITWYDPNTGAIINKPLNTDWGFISSMAHGQAAVKLHVINAQNGTELNQVQNFVDWPNQGKKANLSLPTIRGYKVVSDASAASAALQKLGIKGNVVTQAEAVDYPAADNTTNYYIVMDPVTETATVHFIDQDSGNKELSHVDLTGAYNTPITANGQVTNMLNNYVNNQGYELVSNDLAGNHLYTDAHQDFNIVLKHKTQKRNPDNDPSDATKDITRTINVHNPDGSVKTTTQTAHLTREGVQDEATKQTTWGAWSTGNWAEFDTPAVQDYTPSQAKVNAQTVDSNTQDQTIDITYKANILNKDVDFVVPEVIHRTDQHGQTTIDRTQNVTLHGTVTYNAATSQLVGFDLHSADFPAYDIPQIDGYTSHVQEDHIVSLIPGDTNFDKDAFVKDPSGYFNQIMKGRQGGLDHVIDAKTIPQTTAMQYKDGSVDRSYDFYITYTADPQSAQVIYYDTILKKNVKTDALNGKTDETVNTNIQVPANYVLVPGQNLPTTYTFKGSNNQNIIVNLTHATKDTTTTDPGAHKTVTRTIIVNTPHDGTKTTKQDVQLTRPATLDLVTNTTTYGNWNTGTWAQYDVPAVPGYTPTQGSVPQATVTGDTQNTTVTVNYTANPHVQVIEYVGDSKVQHTQNVNGVTDQTVNGIQPEVPTNWILAPGAKVPTSVTFGPNDPQPIIVNIVHDTKDVTKTDAGAHKSITRTIHVNDPHKGVATTNQVVNLTRPAWFDMVTNDIHYGKWDTGNWAEFDSPAVAGYTVNPAKVAAQTVTSDTKDTIVNVNYTANPQQVVLNFVDKASKVIATHLYKGVTDGTAKIDAQVPTNWVLVPGQTIPTSYTFKPSDNKDVNIVIEHGTKDTSKTDKNAVRDVTRIINLHDPHKGTTTTKQVAHLHRSATLDLVTNQTTYGKWDTDATNWKEFDVPAVDGYTPNMNKVAATTVDENTKDQTIDVTYAANPQQVVLNFVDKAGNVIASHTYKGVTDGTAKIDAQVPENWVLVKGQTIPTDYTFKAEGNKDIDILIEHGTQDVSKTDEKANKDITRTIIVTNPDGKKTTTNQVAHLNRSAIKDLVTGEVTYGQWNTGKWDAFDTPEIAGYDASIHHLDGQNVDINDEDETINIHYNALTHTQDINYVNDNGDVVGTQVVTGQTGETAGFTPDVPNGYTIVPGQDIPKSFTFGANDPKTLVIHVTKPGNNSQTPASNQPASNEPASQTPAQSESGSTANTNVVPSAPTSANNSVAPSAPASANTNAGTETGYAAPATATPVAAATPIATEGNGNAGQGELPQTGDDSISAIAGLSLAGMTGAILAAGALKRRHN